MRCVYAKTGMRASSVKIKIRPNNDRLDYHGLLAATRRYAYGVAGASKLTSRQAFWMCDAELLQSPTADR